MPKNTAPVGGSLVAQWYRAPAPVDDDPWLFGQVLSESGRGWLAIAPHAILDGADGGAYPDVEIVYDVSGWVFSDTADQALALG